VSKKYFSDRKNFFLGTRIFLSQLKKRKRNLAARRFVTEPFKPLKLKDQLKTWENVMDSIEVFSQSRKKMC